MSLDPKTLYWTAAWINMALVVGLSALGIRQIRHARYDTHKTLMLASAGLVGVFVLSYVFKLYFLGREALETWGPSYVQMLRLHELCVLVMLVGGGTSLWQAFRLGLPLAGELAGRSADDVARGIRLHRRAGFVAVAAAALGVLTALYVLQGMYARGA